MRAHLIWAFGLALSAGCSERQTIRLSVPSDVLEAIQRSEVHTLFVIVQSYDDARNPMLEDARVIGNPRLLSATELAGELPILKAYDGAALVVSFVAYEAQLEAFGLSSTGRLPTPVADSAPLRATSMAFRATVTATGASGWESLTRLPESLVDLRLLPPRNPVCSAMEVRPVFLNPGLGIGAIFDGIVGVEGAFLIAARNFEHTLVYRITPAKMDMPVLTATLPPALGRIRTMVFDGDGVFGATETGYLLSLDEAGTLTAPPVHLSAGSLRITSSPNQNLLAYDDTQLWRVHRAGGTSTAAVPAPPIHIHRAAIDDAQRIAVFYGQPGQFMDEMVPKVWTLDQSGWHEISPAEPPRLRPFNDGSGFDMSGRQDGFDLMTLDIAWQRASGDAGWTVLNGPALGFGSPFYTNDYRYLTRMNADRLAFTGGAGLIDVLVARTEPQQWCLPQAGTTNSFDALAALPDESALLVTYNENPRGASQLYWVAIPHF